MADARLNVIISADNKAKGVIEGFQRSIGSIGKLAVGAAAGGVAALGAGAVLAAKDFVGFEQQMREVFTLLPGISGGAMDAMTDQVKGFSREFGVLPEETVPALYQALSAGVPSDNVFSFLETAQKAAAGGVTELTTAVDGITSVVNAYGEEVIGATESSDMMFTAVRLGKTTFGELSGSLSNVTPTASALGLGFENLTAAIATMTSQGVSTSQSTTQLRQLLVELSKEGTVASGAFQEIANVGFAEFIDQGGNLQDALGVMQAAADENGVALQDMFSSVEAGSAALALAGPGAESFRDNLEEMANSAGATDAAFETMDEGLQATINRIKATGKVALLDFADSFKPLLKMLADVAENLLPVFSSILSERVIPVVEDVSAFIRGFVSALQEGQDPISAMIDSFLTWTNAGENLSETARNIVLQFGAFWDRVKEGAAPIIQAIGQFVSAKDVLMALGVAVAAVVIPAIASLLASILPIIAIGALLIGAISLVRNAWENNWLGIRDKTQAVVEFLRNLLQTAITFIRQQWALHGDAIMAKVQAIWSGIQGFISAVMGFIQSVITTVGNAISAFWGAYHDELLALASGIWDAILAFVSGIMDQISLALDTFAALFRGDWEGFLQGIQDLWENGWDTVLSILAALWDAISPILGALWGDIKAWFQSVDWGSLGRNIIDGIVNGISAAGSAILNTLSGIVNGAINAIKARLGISSPSKVFAEMGLQMAEGLALGMGQGAPVVAGAAGNVAGAAVNQSRQVINNYTLNVHSNGAADNTVGNFRLMQAQVGGI